MFDIRKHFVIDDNIQNILFYLQKKFGNESEGNIIRRAILELYEKESKK